MKILDIVAAIENVAPIALQENWDNSGIQIGSSANEAKSTVITLDVTEAVVDDAIKNGDNLIIAHHPLIFGGLKNITGKTNAERAIIKAIKHDITIYAAHTNIDVIKNGVSWKMAQKLGLTNIETLSPQKGLLKKLAVFVPADHIDNIRNAIFEAGAGHIGNYDSCGYQLDGIGSFNAGENTNPYAGKRRELHFEKEIRFETVFPAYLQKIIISALINAHPYEEVAYDIYPIENKHPQTGLGVTGQTPQETETEIFLNHIKETFQCKLLKHTAIHKPTVSKIAMLGGSGSTYLNEAIASDADIFITADFKYHQYFDADNRIIIADVGHYESEQFTKELFYEIVTNKFSKFAVRLTDVNTNPVNYLF
ncbi:MAG: Nif3-like dinuclear metal center hexameric protein [Prolixibacteraceae bacterium]|jgi:dinuclear metal center YbgI/SA1388 family protein|nr:Nif3-like dinuclear metal center hexameric protein [Prolixibacteraceae bacterium]